MCRPAKHPKTGVYQFRKAVPEDLRALLGKWEEKQSLRTKDPEEAKRRFVEVLAMVEARWASLRGGGHSLTEKDAHGLAKAVHDNWLRLHSDEPSNQLIWQTDLYPQLWIGTGEPSGDDQISITDLSTRAMRTFCFQQADFGLEERGLVVDAESRFKLARAIGAALQRASCILEHEARGVYAPTNHEAYATASQSGGSINQARRDRPGSGIGAVELANQTGDTEAATITDLFEKWWQEAKAAGRKPSTHESYRNTVSAFVAFLKHDSVSQLRDDDVVRLKDYRLSTPSPRTGRIPSAKTVKDSDLAALKTLFSWAVQNRRMTINPALGISIKLGKPQKLRSKGFTDKEANALLDAARAYLSATENRRTAAAKRWVPWLCAYTGARVGELAQLRKQDITQDGDHWVIRITPEAGTVKTDEARFVVIHPCIVEQGFPQFIAETADGHLFLQPASDGSVLGPLQGLKNRLAEAARLIVTDPNVAPNHGWRHRFKTVGMEVGIAPRILDAIQGQAAKSVADTYGDVTIRTIASAIYKLPGF